MTPPAPRRRRLPVPSALVWVRLLAGTLLVLGVAVGFVPAGDAGPAYYGVAVSCGAPLSPRPPVAGGVFVYDRDVLALCDHLTGGAGVLAGVLILLGTAGLALGRLIAVWRPAGPTR